MPTKHGFCTLHRIGYNRQLDPTCPQCTLAGLQSDQLDFDPDATQLVQQTVGTPLNAQGKPVDPVTLKVVAN